MNDYLKEDPFALSANVFTLIGRQWMLITAGAKVRFNTMTASWGGLGFLWNRPVAFVFIRPQRYTFEWTEKEPAMTLSFFDETYRSALHVCGTKSGRDTDKIAESGLTPMEMPSGNMSFHEAHYVLECRKLYADFFKEEKLIDGSIGKTFYPHSDFHKMYVVEIEQAWKRIHPACTPSLPE